MRLISKNIYDYDGTTVRIAISSYVNSRNIAVLLITLNGDYYTDVSKNINPLPSDYFAVDVNNKYGLDMWLENNGIAHNTGRVIDSGFASYPIYKLNDTFKNECDEEF